MFSDDLLIVNDSVQSLVKSVHDSDASCSDELYYWNTFVESGFSSLLIDHEYRYLGEPDEVLLALAYLSTNAKIMMPFILYACLAPIVLKLGSANCIDTLKDIETGTSRVAIGMDSDTSFRTIAPDSDSIYMVLSGNTYSIHLDSYNNLLIWTKSDKNDEPLLILINSESLTSCPRTVSNIGEDIPCINIALDGVRFSEDSIIARGDRAEAIYKKTFSLYSAAISLMLYQPLSHALQVTMDHVNIRRQFGKTLSSFQVVRHKISDLTIALAEIEGLLVRALLSNQENESKDKIYLTLAELVQESSISFINSVIQLHGGMGMSEELSISKDMKNIVALSHEFSGKISQLVEFEPGKLILGQLNMENGEL